MSCKVSIIDVALCFRYLTLCEAGDKHQIDIYKKRCEKIENQILEALRNKGHTLDFFYHILYKDMYVFVRNYSGRHKDTYQDRAWGTIIVYMMTSEDALRFLSCIYGLFSNDTSYPKFYIEIYNELRRIKYIN